MYVMYAHMYVFMYLPLAHNGYNCAVNKILFYSIQMPHSNVTLIHPVKLLHNITRFLPLAI